MNKLSKHAVWAILAAPAALQADPDDATSISKPADDGPAPSLGLPPQAAQTGDLIVPITAPEWAQQPTSDDARLQFHGFFRAPAHISLGHLDPSMSSETQIHSPVQVPNATYTQWDFTNTVWGPWTELDFSYGTPNVSATVIVAAWNLTDASYADTQAQLGINQAFLTLRPPKLGDSTRLVWIVGAFSNRYGGSGKYDAGKYETYVIGRTHVAGETLGGTTQLGHDLALVYEHGIGAKLDVVPYFDPPYPPGTTYPGPVPQATTLLHHAHVGLAHAHDLTLGLHYLKAWTQDARESMSASMTMPDASLQILGSDLRLDGGVYGEGYVGYSHLTAAHVLPLADAIEVLHSDGGWELRDNFFGPNSDGTGTIDSVLAQYTFSIATLLRSPEPFWGQGPDVLLSAFGMFNHVRSTDPMFDNKNKLKYGFEATYVPLKWFALSSRFDMVNPDMSDAEQSFAVLSPRLIFRSSFVSHEQIVLGYSRYFYGSKVVPSYPYANLTPDRDLFQASAVMWW
jgi:hypothetical protein